MPVRPNPQKSCDANLAVLTIRKKFVTTTCSLPCHWMTMYLLTPVGAVNCSDWPRAFLSVLLVVLVFILVFFLVLCCSSCPSPSPERPPAGAASGRFLGRSPRPAPRRKAVGSGDGRDETAELKAPEQRNNTTGTEAAIPANSGPLNIERHASQLCRWFAREFTAAGMKGSGMTTLESSSREHPRGEPSLAGLRGVVSTRGSETGKSWRRGSVWCHKCQIHLLPPCWARCHIPLGYGTGTSHEKNFKPLLTPRTDRLNAGNLLLCVVRDN